MSLGTSLKILIDSSINQYTASGRACTVKVLSCIKITYRILVILHSLEIKKKKKIRTIAAEAGYFFWALAW